MSLLSSLLGMDASSNQSKQQASANALSQQAQTGYTGLQNAGAANMGIANPANVTSLLGQFADTAGLALPGGGNTQTNAPVTVNGSAPLITPAGSPNAGMKASATPTGQSVRPESSSYMTPEQSKTLGYQIDAINQAKTQATSELTQQLANRGITDPRAAAAAHQELEVQFTQMSNQARTTAEAQAQQQKEQSQLQLLSAIMGVGQEGTSQTQSGSSGLAGLSGQAQQQANNYGQQSTAAFSDILGLASFGLGGGFGGGAKAASGGVTNMNQIV